MTIPNLLLAGAPKCGTTSVYDWLIAHPDVAGGVEKEVFYLMDPYDWKFNEKRNWKDGGVAQYSSLFPIDKKIVVDGTTLTIYQESALEFARQYKPKAVFFVREPAIRVYSTFKYLKNNRSKIDEKMSFGEFLELIEQEYDFGGINQLSDVIGQSEYSKHIKKYVDAIGYENVKVFVFEDFVRNPSAGMSDLCEWLGIDEKFYDTFQFEKQNESLEMKSSALNKLKERLSPYLKSKRVRDVIKSIYYRVNSRPARKFETTDDAALITDLKARFKDCNAALAEEFKLNLSSWNK